MPLYDFECNVCGNTKEVLQSFEADAPECCGKSMKRRVGNLASWSWGIPLVVPHSAHPTNIDQLNNAASKGWEKVHL